MIVEPDFLTHWKTRALVRMLKDDCAPLYVLALWSHCQKLKTNRFNGITSLELAAICGVTDPDIADALMEALVSCQWLDRDGDVLVVHDFAKTNRTALRAGRRTCRISVEVRIRVLDAGECAHCGGEEHLAVDHIIPVALGGSDKEVNLQCLCRTCNSRKGSRFVG